MSRNISIYFLIFFVITPFACFAGFMSMGGLFDIPSAYVLENTEINVGFSSFLAPKPEPLIPTLDSLNEMDYWVMVGLFDRVDVGVKYYGDTSISAYVKGMVWEESAGIPAIAVGLTDIATKELIGPYGENTNNYYHDQNISFFAVASKDLQPIIKLPLTAHVGFGTGRFVGAWKRSFRWHGIFGALEWRVKDYLHVIGEVDGRDLNVGVKFKLPYGLNVSAGIGEFEQLWLGGCSTVIKGQGPFYDEYDEPKFSISVDWTLGPIISKEEQARLMRLKSRIERAEERLKQAKDRTDSVEKEIKYIEDELIE
jgi:hypothetical protein